MLMIIALPSHCWLGPMSAQVLGSHYVYVIIPCTAVSRFRCTIAPEGENCNVAKKSGLLQRRPRLQCLDVTRNLNDILLEVMFSIAT